MGWRYSRTPGENGPLDVETVRTIVNALACQVLVSDPDRAAKKVAAAAYMQQPVRPPQLISRIRLTKTAGHVLV